MNSSTTLTQSIEFLNSLTSPFEFLSLTPFTLPWAATDFSEHSPPSFPFLSFFPIDPWTIASKAIANSSKNFPFPHFLLRLLLIGTLSCLLLRSISANRWCISSTFWNNRLNYWTSLNSFIRWPLNGPYCISPIDHLSQSHPSTSTLPTSCLNMAESATVRALLILKKIKQQEDEESEFSLLQASDVDGWATKGRVLQIAVNGEALGIVNPIPSVKSTISLPILSQSKHWINDPKESPTIRNASPSPGQLLLPDPKGIILYPSLITPSKP
nr:unnamed protein product [Ipomoea batatas]